MSRNHPSPASRPPSHRRARRLAFCAFGLAGLAAGLTAQPGGPPHAVLLDVRGAIGPATADYTRRGLVRAAERGAALVVLAMDTPGGLDDSMREIIRALLASPIPVATFVHPSGARAASAGTFILYASHIAAMAPGTNLGAATPIQIGGGGSPFGRPEDEGAGEQADTTREGDRGRGARGAGEAKAINDAVAYIRSLAELRGRNADWGERAVREGASLSATQALTEGVIDIIATGIEDLLAQLDGRTVMVGGNTITLATADMPTEHMEPDWRTRLLAAITNPNVALLFMMIGIYGLIFEFMNPGAIYPGTIGAISLLLGLYALAVLPVNLVGAVLILLGLALMTAEAFTPSLGILGIGGAVALVLGLTILIDTDLPDFSVAWPVIGAIAAGSLAFSLLVVPLAVRARRRRVASGREDLVGARGRVTDWGSGTGHVFVHGERWRARAAAPLTQGGAIRVLGAEGLTLIVEPELTDVNQPGRD